MFTLHVSSFTNRDVELLPPRRVELPLRERAFGRSDMLHDRSRVRRRKTDGVPNVVFAKIVTPDTRHLTPSHQPRRKPGTERVSRARPINHLFFLKYSCFVNTASVRNSYARGAS